jgi:hypothetical protein
VAYAVRSPFCNWEKIMPRWGLYAIAVGLACMLVVSARAADADTPPTAESPTGNWFTRWTTPSKPAAPKKSAEKPLKEEDFAQQQKAARAAAAAERGREENALLRRQAVCLKLRTIAAQSNNDELRRQADELDDRAWSVYQRRVAHLPAGGGSEGSRENPAPSHRASRSDTTETSSAARVSAREDVP